MGKVISINSQLAQRAEQHITSIKNIKLKESHEFIGSYVSVEEIQKREKIFFNTTRSLKKQADKYFDELETLSSMQSEDPSVERKQFFLESELDQIILAWRKEVKNWGGLPSGLWQIDFPVNRKDWYRWSYVEKTAESAVICPELN